MVGFLEGLVVTLKTMLRRPVTAQYPDPDKRLKVAERYMGFPALTWDSEVGEPYCTGCMVCIRNCPTQCMSAVMKDNPLHAEGKSRRRKIVDEFEINLGRCILCGICVDVCNFDAIEMSHEHELSKYERNGNRVNLQQLLEMGKRYQAETGWQPKQPEKNRGLPTKPVEVKEAGLSEVVAAKATPKALTQEERLAAARARAAAKRGAAVAEGGAPPADGGAKPEDLSKEERLAAARARAAAKREAAASGGGDENSHAKQGMTPEERLAAARARAAAKREAAAAGDGNVAADAVAAQPRREGMTPEERVAAARARAAKRAAAAAEGAAQDTHSEGHD